MGGVTHVNPTPFEGFNPVLVPSFPRFLRVLLDFSSFRHQSGKRYQTYWWYLDGVEH